MPCLSTGRAGRLTRGGRKMAVLSVLLHVCNGCKAGCDPAFYGRAGAGAMAHPYPSRLR